MKKLIAILLLTLLVPTIAIDAHSLLTDDENQPLVTEWKGMKGRFSIRAGNIEWSPKGDKIAAIDSKLYVFSESGELLWEMSNATEYFSWSPDGTMIAVAYYNEEPEARVIVYNEHGGILWMTPNLAGNESYTYYLIPRWSPSGDYIAVAFSWYWSCCGNTMADGKILLLDAESGSVKWMSENIGEPLWKIAWSRDGKLAAGTYEGRLIIWGENDIVWQKNLQGELKDLSWAPDGSLTVLVDRGDGGVLLAMNESGHVLWEKSYGERARSVEWCPSGDMFAVATERNLYIYDENRDLLWHSPIRDIRDLSWRPGCDMLAANPDYRLYVYGLTTGFIVLRAPDCCAVNVDITDTSEGTKMSFRMEPNETKILYGYGVFNMTVQGPRDSGTVSFSVNKSEVKTIDLGDVLRGEGLQKESDRVTETPSEGSPRSTIFLLIPVILVVLVLVYKKMAR